MGLLGDFFSRGLNGPAAPGAPKLTAATTQGADKADSPGLTEEESWNKATSSIVKAIITLGALVAIGAFAVIAIAYAPLLLLAPVVAGATVVGIKKSIKTPEISDGHSNPAPSNTPVLPPPSGSLTKKFSDLGGSKVTERTSNPSAGLPACVTEERHDGDEYSREVSDLKKHALDGKTDGSAIVKPDEARPLFVTSQPADQTLPQIKSPAEKL